MNFTTYERHCKTACTRGITLDPLIVMARYRGRDRRTYAAARIRAMARAGLPK